MTSEENNEKTIEFFEEMNYFDYPKEHIIFFKQEEEPLLSKEGKLLIGEDNLIRVASNGNGAVYKSMKKQAVLEDMKNREIEWIVICGIDNILAKVVDPLLLGMTIDAGNLIASKSVVKQTIFESGGVFAKADGKPDIIEYVEVPEEIAKEKDSKGEFVYGDINIVNHLFNIKALDKIANEKLPYHTAIKKCKFIDENGNKIEDKIYKFEKFIFDGFIYFNEISLLRVKREEEFAPIKNAEGEDSPQTAKKLYEDYLKTLKV